MADKDNVVQLPFQRPAVSDLAGQILELVYSYAGRISLAEAIGVLEIAKVQLIEGNK